MHVGVRVAGDRHAWGSWNRLAIDGEVVRTVMPGEVGNYPHEGEHLAF